MYLMLSLIGLFSADRLITMFIQYSLIESRRFHFSFYVLCIPVYFFMYFKEHFSLLMIYIGTILLTLIFFLSFIEKKMKKVFFLTQLNVLSGLILQIRTGKSPQRAFLDIFELMIGFQKKVYQPLALMLSHDLSLKKTLPKWSSAYFIEIEAVLKSDQRIIQQIEVLRAALKVRNKFISRKTQVTQQIRAQAIVAIFVYLIIFMLSWYQLNLIESKGLIVCSIIFLAASIYLIFKLGGRVKWTI